MSNKIKVAIVGPGNIGTDLMYKILKRSKFMELAYMIGIDPDSEGLKRAAALGIKTSHSGMEEMLQDEDVKIVFEATSAKGHYINAPIYLEANKIAVDLTPAAVGPYVVPVVNMGNLLAEKNVNLVTCGGQATVPIVAAVSQVQPVLYAEIVSTISSLSAGPGTRANIDEFTETTSKALEIVGGAKKGKAIIILNPAEPPIMMRNTIYTLVENNPDMKKITESVNAMVMKIQQYVPGYKLKVPPIWDGEKITTMIEVEGAGDFLPAHAGNLDIINSAAFIVGDTIAEYLLKQGSNKV
ncbi:MAG TPA: acetaldehyde dehydrogenase (acetylating) [Desulfosporosinus sp.]|nr:acetaldehyde dehydrogenase (acetylating) [Desulfosporosinus sp.]